MALGTGEVLVAASETVGALKFLAESSPPLVKHGKRWWNWLMEGNLLLPIFGAGGVGKSTAGRILAGLEGAPSQDRYKESSWTEVIKLGGDRPGFIKVAPGQEWRQATTWPPLFLDICNNKTKGFLNVVSYGHHSLGLPSIRGSDLWRDGMSNKEFAAEYISDRRAHEIVMIEKLVDGLTALTQPIWMVTLVTKQDLWYQNQESVINHYRDGEYHQHVRRLEERLGAYGFRHEYIPVALTLSNLVSESGEVLATTSGGFDLNNRNRSLESMAEMIEELMAT